MNNKIRTIDEGLRYLYQVRKECRNNLYGRMKMRILGHAVAAVMLFRGKYKSSKANIPGNIETLRRMPWSILAYAAGIACVIGIIAIQSRRRV